MGFNKAFAFPTMTALIEPMSASLAEERGRKGEIQISDCQVDCRGKEGGLDDQTADLHDEPVVESNVIGTACTANISDCLAYNKMTACRW